MSETRGHSFKCADCRVVIEHGVQYEAWELMRAHTLETHGRDPHCNPVGQYPDEATRLKAEYGAHPELFLMMVA